MQIVPMEMSHIDQVVEIEEQCFAISWTKADFIREINENKLAIYFVAIYNDKVAGYAGMWHVVTEGHITNIAVLPEYQGQGIGDALVQALLATAEEREMIGVTLEVKIGNSKAQKLYVKYGFRSEGIRKRYYEDTGEDAIIMWKYFNLENQLDTTRG